VTLLIRDDYRQPALKFPRASLICAVAVGSAVDNYPIDPETDSVIDLIVLVVLAHAPRVLFRRRFAVFLHVRCACDDRHSLPLI
jgi:hypothetical protein